MSLASPAAAGAGPGAGLQLSTSYIGASGSGTLVTSLARSTSYMGGAGLLYTSLARSTSNMGGGALEASLPGVSYIGGGPPPGSSLGRTGSYIQPGTSIPRSISYIGGGGAPVALPRTSTSLTGGLGGGGLADSLPRSSLLGGGPGGLLSPRSGPGSPLQGSGGSTPTTVSGTPGASQVGGRVLGCAGVCTGHAASLQEHCCCWNAAAAPWDTAGDPVWGSPPVAFQPYPRGWASAWGRRPLYATLRWWQWASPAQLHHWYVLCRLPQPLPQPQPPCQDLSFGPFPTGSSRGGR